MNGLRWNGKGKEYLDFEFLSFLKNNNNDDDNLIFEGEYLNGKKWKGFIKLFDGFDLVFKGDCVCGEKNGLGKEYKRKKLIYEGNFSNGKRSGEGKKYHEITGKLMFEGDFLYGRKKKEKNI